MSRRVHFACVFIIVFFCSTSLCSADEERSMLMEPSPEAAKNWAPGNTLVTDPAVHEAKPSMTSAPNGDLYVAVEETASEWISLYRSTNGGDTWSALGAFASGDDTRNPAIAYGEHSNGEKWLYVAYEQVTTATGNRFVRVFRMSLVGSPPTFTTVDGPFIMASAGDEVHPQITTDFPTYGDLHYVYLTYAKFAIDYYPVYSARTTDRGATWSTPLNVTGGSENTGWAARPDIAYGTSGLFIAFVKPGWDGSAFGNQIWVTKSTNFGSSYSTPIQITTFSQDVWHPSVAAAYGNDSVVVAFTYDYGVDTDVFYTYSTNGGSSWSSPSTYPSWTFDHESHVDLEASTRNGGYFHAAYHHELVAGGSNATWYSQANTTAPGTWSSALQINEAATVSGLGFYPKPTVAVMPGVPIAAEAAIAWSDYSGFYDAYFDTVALFADGFASGDTSVWSSTVP